MGTCCALLKETEQLGAFRQWQVLCIHDALSALVRGAVGDVGREADADNPEFRVFGLGGLGLRV